LKLYFTFVGFILVLLNPEAPTESGIVHFDADFILRNVFDALHLELFHAENF
jgi:hypothetical protein